MGVCFSNLSTFNAEVLEQRLQIYEKIRINRASVMQVFSNAGQDQAEIIREAASKFMDAEKVPSMRSFTSCVYSTSFLHWPLTDQCFPSRKSRGVL